MANLPFKALAAALLLGGSGLALAANDGQARANELLSADAQYRETWQDVVKKEERLPEWVMNLSGTAEQMNAVSDMSDRHFFQLLAGEHRLPHMSTDLSVQFAYAVGSA